MHSTTIDINEPKIMQAIAILRHRYMVKYNENPKCLYLGKENEMHFKRAVKDYLFPSSDYDADKAHIPEYQGMKIYIVYNDDEHLKVTA